MDKLPQGYRVKTDRNNLLLVSAPGQGYTPLIGEYKFNKRGELVYKLKKPQPKALGGLRRATFRLKGTYALDSNSNLLVRLRRRVRGERRDSITIRGEWIAARSDKFVFSYRLARRDGGFIARTLSFSGTWRADKNNRLSFKLALSRYYSSSSLTLQGAWDIRKDNTVIYRYRRRRSLRAREATSLHTIVFKGRWEISDNLALRYFLEGTTSAVFGFDVRLVKDSINARDEAIRYIIGIKARTGLRSRRLSIYGKWILKGRYELGFEVAQTTAQKPYVVTFRGRYRIDRNGQISFSLSKTISGPVKVTLRFRRKFLDGKASLFARGELDSNKEWALLAGTTIPF